MGESIISIACIHEVSPSILSSILDKAYHEAREIHSPPTLVLLSKANEASLHDCVSESVTVTHPPISGSFASPFLGWSIHDIAQYLEKNARESIMDSTLFLVADEKTSKDGNTLLLVEQTSDQYTGECVLKSVRLAAEFANTKSVAVSVGSTSIEEMLSLVSTDGIYRGGRDLPGWKPPKKGGPAPRKQF